MFSIQLRPHLICVGQKPEVSEADAIKNAVASRMQQLDEAFLVALAAYIGAAEEQGDAALAGTHGLQLLVLFLDCMSTWVCKQPAYCMGALQYL